MKIVKLQAENIKRLVAVEITPDGNLVPITGRNGAGKSSVLDAIFWALAGTRSHQREPIRQGQDKATITVDLGKYVVKRTFKKRTVEGEDGEEEQQLTTSVRVEAQDGASYASPQKMLDKLLDSLSFDPLEFARMDPKAQHHTLKTLCGLDFTAQEAKAADAYATRTDCNRTAKDRRAAAAAIAVPQDAPGEAVDVAGLVERLEEAEQANRARERALENREGIRRDIESGENAAADIQRQIDQLKAQIDALEKRKETMLGDVAATRERLENAAPIVDPVDTAPIREEIAGAEAKNALVRAREQRSQLETQAEEAEAASEACTKIIQDAAAEMKAMIAKADMPVEGLGFDEGMVLFNGLPFEQASDAEQLRISCAIAMRGNPELRVIRVRDGSLLDGESLQMLSDLADKEDFQCWIEIVDTSGEMGFVIEAGQVKDTAQGGLFDGEGA